MNIRPTRRLSNFLPQALLSTTILSLLLLSGATANAAEDPEDGDIRNLKIGVNTSDLPRDGYVHLRCDDPSAPEAAEPIALDNFDQYQRCPRVAGEHRVAFDYDDADQQWAPVNDKWEGTKIAGHPVLLSLSIDPDGTVVAINAKTDPDARAYLRKKAYLLSLRVKARYGRDGWKCTALRPGAKESAVGGIFINERCEKSLTNRRIQLHTRLLRTDEQSMQEAISSTEFRIVKDSS